MTGTYCLQTNCAAFNQNDVDPTCKLCDRSPETLQHMIWFWTVCMALSDVRAWVLADVVLEIDAVGLGPWSSFSPERRVAPAFARVIWRVWSFIIVGVCSCCTQRDTGYWAYVASGVGLYLVCALIPQTIQVAVKKIAGNQRERGIIWIDAFKRMAY